MSWFEDNSWWLWLALALTLGAVEAATVDLVFLMLAGGALAGALTAAIGLGVPIQVISAVVVATAMLGLVRPQMSRRLFKGQPVVLGHAAHVGTRAIVVETVTAHDGRVKIGGETWSARTGEGHKPIEAGRDVQVIAIDGATAVVVLPPPVQDQT